MIKSDGVITILIVVACATRSLREPKEKKIGNGIAQENT